MTGAGWQGTLHMLKDAAQSAASWPPAGTI